MIADIVQYLESLGYDNSVARELPDGRIAWVHRFAFTHAILVMHPPNAECYEDRWCYETRHTAVAALEDWNPDVDKEPIGWHRHPATGRRRPGGDASKEYINP